MEPLRVETGTFDDEHDQLLLPSIGGGEVPATTGRLLRQHGLDPTVVIRQSGLREPGDTCVVATGGAEASLRLVHMSDRMGQVTERTIRRAAQICGRQLEPGPVLCALHADLPIDDLDLAAIVTESILLGYYRFDRYKSTPGRTGDLRLALVAASARSVGRGRTLADATNLARDLVNTPAADLVPEALSELAVDLSQQHAGWSCEVLGLDELSAGGFGGLLGVAAGSVHPPQLIVLERGDNALPVTALVGKGITFDSGGLDLKDLENMVTMKGDLAGVASIIGTLVALDGLGSATHVKAYLACAENMPSATATRPGDILRHRNGISTEVVSPDAEGRLVLADALSYACEFGPDRVVDVSTLTGSTALGRDVWAVLGTSQDLVDDIVSASARAGDPGWQLPLWDGYDEYIESGVADIKNAALGIRWNFGAILGALYLRRFVADVPWAHIDMSATVFREEADRMWVHGATGSSTRALITLLE